MWLKFISILTKCLFFSTEQSIVFSICISFNPVTIFIDFIDYRKLEDQVLSSSIIHILITVSQCPVRQLLGLYALSFLHSIFYYCLCTNTSIILYSSYTCLRVGDVGLHATSSGMPYLFLTFLRNFFVYRTYSYVLIDFLVKSQFVGRFIVSYTYFNYRSMWFLFISYLRI